MQAASETSTFDLIDGFKDDKGTIHKTVVMRQMTMQDQITIKDGDAGARKLLSSSYSLESANQVERMFALAEFNQFYCIVFKQTVIRIGAIEQQDLRDRDVFTKLTARDIGLMIQYQNGSGGRLVKLDRVLEIIDQVRLSDGLRTELRGKLREELGESQTAAAS